MIGVCHLRVHIKAKTETEAFLEKDGFKVCWLDSDTKKFMSAIVFSCRQRTGISGLGYFEPTEYVPNEWVESPEKGRPLFVFNNAEDAVKFLLIENYNDMKYFGKVNRVVVPCKYIRFAGYNDFHSHLGIRLPAGTVLASKVKIIFNR